MKKVPLVIVLFALLILLLAACAPVYSVAGVSTPPAAQPPQGQQVQTTTRDAQVQSVEVQVVQSDLLQVNAVVRGNLSDSCATFGDTQTTYAANTFQIKLVNVIPSDQSCVQSVTPYEQTIPLDTAGLAPGTYTVIVNGVSAVFTIPGGPPPTSTSLQLVVRLSDGRLQVTDLDIPLNPTARPMFNGFLPLGGAAAGNAYVLDSNQLRGVVSDGKGFHDLEFVQSPAPYGLAVWPGDAKALPHLAWATQNIGGDSSSTIKMSAADGMHFDTLLTQDASNPPTQLIAEFFSADGQWLYFSKEPVGLGGYVLFGGGSNLYKINTTSKDVVEVIPQAAASEPQACLDAISADFRYVADHCSIDTISVLDQSSGKTTTIQPPADATAYKFAGSARFSPDSSRLAYALAKGDQADEQGWVAVSEGLSGNSKLVLTSPAGSYYTVAGWLDDQTVLVESTNPTACSPYCKSELWTVKADGSGAQKVADGSFLTIVPNDSFIQLPVEPAPTAQTAPCVDAAEYVDDDGQDGTTYPPNTAFTKTWTLKNVGTCTWDSNYLVYQVSGVYMTQQPAYFIVSQGHTVEPGQTVDISLGMTSYPKNGAYRSDWGLKNAAGQVISIAKATDENTFYVKIKVSDGTDTGKVTASAIDISHEEGSGEVCTADATYFVHAYISTNGPTTVSYEIGSSAGQISAGYFEDENGQNSYVTGALEFDKADTKQVNLRFVGPYPYPEDITVMLRVNGGEWYNTKLFCP